MPSPSPAWRPTCRSRPGTALGNVLPTQPSVTSITPLDTGAFGATTFLVHFAFPNGYTPPEAATYSYAVGPDISDRIRTLSSIGTTVSGNNMDQNGNAITGETSTTVAGHNDAFADPEPTDGVPFQLPYVTTTLPLITPGPHVVAATVYDADGSVESAATQPDLVKPLATPVTIPAPRPAAA